jgi:hypothetical protein
MLAMFSVLEEIFYNSFLRDCYVIILNDACGTNSFTVTARYSVITSQFPIEPLTNFYDFFTLGCGLYVIAFISLNYFHEFL